jgi:hypothetical protein
MQKTILVEASALTEIEKMDLFDQGRRRENLGACKIDKLIRYYHICLDHGYFAARVSIEVEFTKRGLKDYIVPMKELTAPIPKGFTLELAQSVIDAKGDIAVILKEANNAFSYATVIVQAYVMALAFDEVALARALETYIKSIGTYTRYMRRYLELCQINTGVAARLAELAKDMEAYKSWA